MHIAQFPAEAPSIRFHSFESDSGMPSAFSLSFNSPAPVIQNQIAPVSRFNSHADPFLPYPSRSPPLQAISVSSRTPAQNTTPKASTIDSLTELETEDLDQSGSRSFFSPSFAAPASEKSNLRDSISTTTDGWDIRTRPCCSSFAPSSLLTADLHTEDPANGQTRKVNANPKQSLLVNPFTSHSKRRNTSISPINQTQLQSAMKDPILTTHFAPMNDAPRAQTLPGPHTRPSKTPFSPAVGYGQLTLGRSTDGDQDGLKETISSTITLSPTSIWRGKGIGPFAGSARQPPVPPPPLLSRPPILKSWSNWERVAGMALTMHTDEDKHPFVSSDDDTTFFTSYPRE
ncbi:hypothetical protein BLNAU_9318 [Blattamonas nauphoetae]|uniref:Uncharacterized protein n=1 Tax=Blattamonas nauphoetae TaxID=2049346 RepID=A0ABQ9XWC5_9EUKA|nr:hypothetical protein BLNAU_9318 [Blattamonas nauphoetae]